MEQVYDAKQFTFLEEVRAAYPIETKEGEPARVVLKRLEGSIPVSSRGDRD
jgi:hypothetical protein